MQTEKIVVVNHFINVSINSFFNLKPIFSTYKNQTLDKHLTRFPLPDPEIAFNNNPGKNDSIFVSLNLKK